MKLQIPPAFRHRRYAAYWAGIFFAWAGMQMFLWTAFWHIRILSDRPEALGAVGLIRFLPTLFLSLGAGLTSDRFDRRRVLFITQAGMALLAAGLWVLGQRAGLVHLYVFIALQSAIFTFALPARQSVVPNLVPAGVLANALSLQTLTFQAGGLAGPALSGYLIDRWGVAATYAMSALLQGIMLLVLLRIGRIEQRFEPLQRRQRSLRHSLALIRAGLRFTFSNPLILSSTLLDFFATLLTRADPLMPIVASDILRVGPVEYGWLASAQAAGSTLAGLTLSQVPMIRRQGRLLFSAMFTIGAGTIVFGLSRSLPLTLLALMLIGASDAASSIIRNTLRQLETPDEMRGRMTGVTQIFFMGGPQLGEWRSGLLAGWMGVPLSLAVGGGTSILVTGWIAAKWPALRKYEGNQ